MTTDSSKVHQHTDCHGIDVVLWHSLEDSRPLMYSDIITGALFNGEVALENLNKSL